MPGEIIDGTKTAAVTREHVARADIVAAAVGRAPLIQGEWIKPGAAVIDAGYNAGNVGDVEYQAARNRAALIKPVSGGAGPMTTATRLEQTVLAAQRHEGEKRRSLLGSLKK